MLLIVAESAVKLWPAAGVSWAPAGPVADVQVGRGDSFAPDWQINRHPHPPPNGLDFLVLRMLWRTRSPLKRLEPIMPGERSMSIGR
jgi:hypothetical protein